MMLILESSDEKNPVFLPSKVLQKILMIMIYLYGITCTV